MSQYVRLFAPSDYAQPQGQWTHVIMIAVIAAVLLVAGSVMLCTTAVFQKRRKEAKAESEAYQSAFQTDYFHHDDNLAITDTGPGMLGSLLVGIALAFLAVCAVASLCNMNDSSGYTGARQGNLPADNMALVEQSYRLRDVRADTRVGESVDAYLTTDNNPANPRYLNVVAQSDDGSIRHLTLKIDKNNHLRAYESTGDTQHLVTPAQSSSKEKSKP